MRVIATLVLICLFRTDSLFSQELVAKARDEKSSSSITAPVLKTRSKSLIDFANVTRSSRSRTTEYPA